MNDKSTELDDATASGLTEFKTVYVIIINEILFWRVIHNKKWAYDIRHLLKQVAPNVKCEIKETAYYPENTNDY